ncbi:MAG: YdeI/OmpD-associated family protein [Acidimicrobiales bacterium]|nr:YdeI/OmpD-associated family protein [Acidimicrobiales bacterium]
MGADTDPKVDAYIDRSTKWPDELAAVRPILLDAGLTEAIKWGKPCYSHGKANIAILQEMKGFLAVMFFKGSLLEDPGGVLVEQGPNSRAAKRIELTSVDGVARLADTIAAYVAEAIDVEEAGLQVAPAPEPALCAELQHRIDTDAAFKAAFEGLTPGRRREYNLQIAGAKQASTREARVEKYAPKILAGKGFRD